MLLVYAVLFCCINSALSGITTTPGFQRNYVGETTTFQWSVTGSISSYSVHNQTLGYPGQFNTYANYILDRQSGTVILTIKNIQLSDAGNYSLSVTIGSTTEADATALLFVYGPPTIYVNQTSGGSSQLPATEGDTVELTCTAISTSLPVSYRPQMYYRWYLPWIGMLQNISSGQAIPDGSLDAVPGYNIKNDGKTLVIASAQYRDTQGIPCYGQEQWSPSSSSSPYFYLPLKYRPYISSRTPVSRKFNAAVGDRVSLSFSVSAMPDVTSATNWSFVNTAGQAQELPTGFYYSHFLSSYSLAFRLSSEANYGNYSITFNNTMGSTTDTFQVLRLGPPDAPSSVTEKVVASDLIVIGWNCMWFNGSPQQIFLQLQSLSNNSVIDILHYTVSDDCYNSSNYAYFKNGIQPETDYEVNVWSTNDLGSSNTVKLAVKTPKIFKLECSPKTISFNKNQAIINFSATEGQLTVLYVECCLELTGICDHNVYYNLNDTVRQVTYSNLPMGNAYLCDLYAYGGNRHGNSPYTYLGAVKCVRLSRMEIVEPEAETNPNPQPIAVIVLGVLLGVAVLALIACLIAFLVSKRCQETQPNNSKQQPTATANTRTQQPAAQRNNQAYGQGAAYEELERKPPRNEACYTSLQVESAIVERSELSI